MPTAKQQILFCHLFFIIILEFCAFILRCTHHIIWYKSPLKVHIAPQNIYISIMSAYSLVFKRGLSSTQFIFPFLFWQLLFFHQLDNAFTSFDPDLFQTFVEAILRLL